MQKTYALRDNPWERIKGALPRKPGDQGRTVADNRLSTDAVVRVARTSAPRRKLPPECGNRPRARKRFMRWAKSGVRRMIFSTPPRAQAPSGR